MNVRFRSVTSAILLLLIVTGVDLFFLSEAFADAAQPIFHNADTYISLAPAEQPKASLHSGSAAILICLLDSNQMPCECSAAVVSALNFRTGNVQRLRAFNSTTRGKIIPLFSITKDFSEHKNTPDCFGEFPFFPPELDGLTNIRKTE